MPPTKILQVAALAMSAQNCTDLEIQAQYVPPMSPSVREGYGLHDVRLSDLPRMDCSRHLPD